MKLLSRILGAIILGVILGTSVSAIAERGALRSALNALANNTYFQARNAAGSAWLDVLKADTSDNTVLNAATGKTIGLAVNGSNVATVSSTALTVGGTVGIVRSSAALDSDVTGNTGTTNNLIVASGSTTYHGFISNGNNSASSGLMLFKTRSTGTDGNTTTQTNDRMGFFSFFGSDGTTYRESANILSYVDGTPASNSVPGRLEFGTAPSGTSYPVKRLTIDSAGVVGFNTAGNESTGAGTALLGSNSPATTVSAPYTWIKLKTSDGSTVYMPVWK